MTGAPGISRTPGGKRWRANCAAYQPLTGDLRHQLATLAADPANRRDLAWLVLHAIIGLPLAALAVALPLSAVQHLAVSSYWSAGGRGAVSSGGIVINSWTAAVVSAVIGIVYGALALRAPEAATAQARVAAALLAPDENALLAVSGRRTDRDQGRRVGRARCRTAPHRTRSARRRPSTGSRR